ncbi:unnamed protein product [Rhizoctonia solani]|uniref:Uncharacterized protein n=1 Tax=Rhizoctonia solani TaxID=456999 RepID=A0A8H3D1Y7_9AGAM|nr:unnamed protein product [Rhizoctonia solani]
MSTHPNLNRLIPYAKDHDRLQLALLYLEVECNRYKYAVDRLKSLREAEETIQKHLQTISQIRDVKIMQYIQERHPAKYIDSSGQVVIPDFESQPAQNKEEPGGWHDEETEFVFSMEQTEVNALKIILDRIAYFEAEKKSLSECVAQREEILKLIEELHSTAFDGETPEFPHEDQLEALVQLAEIALKGEQAGLDKLRREDGLAELGEIAHSALTALNEISVLVEEVCGRLDRERPLAPAIFLLKEFWKFKIPDRCKTVAQRYQAWKEGIDNHFSKHPDTILSPLAQTMLPQVDYKELMEIFSRVASMDSSVQEANYQIAVLLSDSSLARGEIRAVINATELMKSRAEKDLRKAKTVLELRHRQLAAARTQILDHVVDPEKCPLQQRAEELPDYPEEIALHGLSESHPSVSCLLTDSETYSVEAYVNDIAHSRLNRARRTTHPPVLLSGRYQPPGYDELKDPERLRRRYQRDVPAIDGDTPEYSKEPDYEGVIQTEPRELSPIMEEELDELVSRAREQLGLRSRAQLEQLNEMARTVMGLLESSGIPFIMAGPEIRF